MLPATSFLGRGHCSQQFNCCELIWQQAGMMTWENVRYEDNIVGYQLYYSELFCCLSMYYTTLQYIHPGKSQLFCCCFCRDAWIHALDCCAD